MKIDANDPKWTAYALGEITDEQERAEIQSILEESEEMRRLVEDIRETAGLLKAELRAEEPVGLTQAQRERIEQKAGTGKSWFGWRSQWALATAAAAVLLISFVAVRYFKQTELIPNQTQITQVTQKELPSTTQPATERTDISKTYEVPAPAHEIKSRAESGPAAQWRLETDRLAAAPTIPTESVATAGNVPVLKKEELYAKSDGVDLLKAMKGEAKDASGKPGSGAGMGAAGGAPGGMVDGKVQTDKPLSAAEQILKAESGTGTVMDEKAAQSLPLIGNDAMQLVGVMGGAVTSESSFSALPKETFAGVNAAQLNIQRDGILVSDARYRLPSPPPRPAPRKRMLPPWQKPGGDFNTEAYDNILDNPFLDAAQNPLSTFSIDVDTASYSNVRRFLDGGSLPPKDAVRIEELVNYFDYDYAGPKNGKPFAANFEITEAPWKPEHRLLRIGLKAREVALGKRPDSNLVFLLDVSGSMADQNKLPLVKESMTLLVDQLTEADSVAIVVYASDTSVFLKSTSGDQKEKIRHAIERLHAGGSTNGAGGIQLAYKTAKDNFIKGGINRVILATDGDFNVGITNRGDLTRLIEDKAKSGIFLSALGFGMGNYKDATLEMLANKGRGNYAYIDTPNEAKKVLVEQINSTLVPVAKDVKIQVEFNPQRVSSYRLIGYEDRIMAKEDFNDDTKQAGVIGAGHAVTALYEIVPVGVSEPKPGVDPLKYQKQAQPSPAAQSDELLTVKIRSKEPEGDKSVLSEFAVRESKQKFGNASRDFKFAAAVAAFGMALRDSPYKGSTNMENALDWAKAGKGEDKHGYRQEFIRLIHRAISISD